MGARRSRRAVCAAAVTVAAITALVPSRAGASATPFISGLTTISEIASTVPANGDINPYGVAVVHHSHGKLRSGSVLVSNFNASSNQQGTGSTIVEITPAACTRSSPVSSPATCTAPAPAVSGSPRRSRCSTVAG